MKQAFIFKTFRENRAAIIKVVNQVVEDYQAQGYRLTLRQLFYQLVTKNIIPNTERSYKNLGEAVSDGRLAGLIDWDAIEDRVRVPRKHPDWNNIGEIVESALASYRLPRWAGQENYVELWVEKDALAGVLSPIANEYHITLMVNRGYSSQSAMYESAIRFRQAVRQGHHTPILLYLGDHDPSGEDMVRDVRERLRMFGIALTVEKIALTMAQVEQYNPPPNPAKMSDSRAAAYVEEHGTSSWEVDALPPNVLSKLIRSTLDGLVDRDLMDQQIAQEEKDKGLLRKAVVKVLQEEGELDDEDDSED